MAEKLIPLHGPSVNANAYVGTNSEVSIDSGDFTLLVHDGVTPGGHKMAKKGDLGTAASKDIGADPDEVQTNELKKFKSFDSLTSAVSFVSASPGSLENITTASYRSKTECDSLGIDYPDGGGADYVVGTGFGVADGAYIIDAGTKKITLNITGPVNVLALGTVRNGVFDNSEHFAIAGTGPNTQIHIPTGDYNLDSDAWMRGDIEITTGPDVVFRGAGRIKGSIPAGYGAVGTIATGNTSPLAKNGGSKWDTFEEGGTAYLGTYLSLIRKGVPTANTETDVVRIEARTAQESDYNGFRAGLVGLHTKIGPEIGNNNSRVWGLNPYMDIPPNSDGLVHGCEVNIINYGSEVKVMNSKDAKYGFNATCEAKGHTGTAYPATGAYKVGTGAGAEERWWTGFWAGETSLVSDPAAQFIELDKRFGVNKLGTMGLGIEYSHADYSFTINGDGDYVHAKAATNPEQYGKVVAPSLGQLDAKILLNSGTAKSAQVTFSGKLSGAIYSLGRDDTDNNIKLVSGTNVRSGTELLSISSVGNAKIKGQVLLGVGVNDPVADGVTIVMQNVASAPTATVAGQGVLYVETGALKFRGGSGTVTTIAPA